MKPMQGVKVLELGTLIAGPFCTRILAEFGADVIKVELPGSGDDTRAWGPPFIDKESTYFLSVNRNKRSITLDLKSDLGKEALWRLIDSADVLVENFSPGTIARLGFGYEAVKARNPKLIFASISGFGQSGPSAGRTAYDLIVQGMSGMMSITGEKGGRPTKTGPPVADIGAGMFTAYAIAAALYGREHTGEGNYIDTSMLGGQIALLTYHAGTYFTNGSIPTAQGNAHAIIVPYDTFPTGDGFVNIAVGNDRLFLSSLLDLYDRQVIAYQIGPRADLSLATATLRQALATLGPTEQPLVHTDQGFQYQHASWHQLLRCAGATASMSRKGTCLDNAVIESFFSHLKSELLLEPFDSIAALQAALVAYLVAYLLNKLALLWVVSIQAGQHRLVVLAVAARRLTQVHAAAAVGAMAGRRVTALLVEKRPHEVLVEVREQRAGVGYRVRDRWHDRRSGRRAIPAACDAGIAVRNQTRALRMS